jgi:hypothetical protein
MCKSYLSCGGQRLYLDCVTQVWRQCKDKLDARNRRNGGANGGANGADEEGEECEECDKWNNVILSIIHDQNSAIRAEECLVIFNFYNYDEGCISMLEKLQSSEILMEQYSNLSNGGRKMLALAEGSVEDLCNCLNIIVNKDYDSDDEYDDLIEGLKLADNVGAEFMDVIKILRNGRVVPIEPCLDYVTDKLDRMSEKEAELKTNIFEYYRECERLENEIDEMRDVFSDDHVIDGVNVKEIIQILDDDAIGNNGDTGNDHIGESEGGEEFWREVNADKDRFEAIARFWGKYSIQ